MDFFKKDSSKVISLAEYRKKNVLNDVNSVFNSLKNDYDLEVTVNSLQVSILIDKLYQYYENKGIVFSFSDTMIRHFYDMAIDAVNENCVVDLSFVLKEIYLYELLDSQIEVNPKEIKKQLKKVSVLFI